ncbi:MAG: TetR/AcrR family transcriptional regulator [Termitinemataceae bacterium]|jgi:AcrR family transcriptional regulator|nr:MAG: TetR/AcrR family transcriptional regulator [Termitinemataceae bacterium]
MKEVQDHRGTRKTRNAIRNSLIELMEQKAITQITVTEICEKADIHRTTFYAHYDDQFDLLKQLEKEAMTQFDNLLDENKCGVNHASQKIVMAEEILRYIASNNNSIQVLLSKNGDIYFQEKFVSRLTTHLQRLRRKHTGEKINDKKNIYYSIFLVHGAIAVIQLWLKNNMDIPIPEIAKILLKITQETKSGVW